MSRSRLWLGRLGLMAFSGVVSLYACEAILRVLYAVPTPLANHYPLEAAKLGKVIRIKQVEFETQHRYNAQGFRGPEITPKKGHLRRLLFVGDSFVEGFGVEEEDRFSNRLVEKLGPGYEEINVGQLATNPYVYLDNIAKFGIGLEPDVIIMGFFLGNDFMGGRKLPATMSGIKINRQVSLGRNAGGFGLLQLEYVRAMWQQVRTRKLLLVRKQEGKGYWELFFREPVTKELYARLLNLKVSQMEEAAKGMNQIAVQNVYSGMLHTGMFEEGIKSQLHIDEQESFYLDEDYEKTFACIREAHRMAEEHRIRFVVLLIPDINQVHPAQFQEVFLKDFLVERIPVRLNQLVELHARLRNDLSANHIPFVDATEALRHSDSLAYYLYDNHMNARGHEIVSDELMPEIRRLLPSATAAPLK